MLNKIDIARKFSVYMEKWNQEMDPRDFFRGFFGMPPRQPGENISINYIKDSSPEIEWI